VTDTSEVWRPEDRLGFVGPALLDTHVWIWYLEGNRARLDEATVELLRRCVRGEGLWVSDISVWEVGTKAAKGQLLLMPDVSAWIEQASHRPGFSFLPLDRSILLGSTRLPGQIHGDPADRMLIASATLAGVPLVTADHLIVAYAEEQGGVSVCQV
jgi:PIN domain nuclease of toxin-antitoxin system